MGDLKWSGVKRVYLAEFQRLRTDAIGEMFNNVDEHGIYPTTEFFNRLDECVERLLQDAYELNS